jgi:hypothetical protein
MYKYCTIYIRQPVQHTVHVFNTTCTDSLTMTAICKRNMQQHQTQLSNQGINLGAAGNKHIFILFRRISYFTQGLRTAAPPPLDGSHNRTATNTSSNHVTSSMSSGCTQGTKYVLFGQQPYRSAYTTRHSAGWGSI